MIYIVLFFQLISSAIPQETLSVIHKYKLDIPEMSGMCRVKINGKTSIAIVSDATDKVYLVSMASDGPRIKKTIDIEKLKGKMKIKGGQWESIYSDDSGRLYLLQEHPSRLVVINKKLDSIESIITLASSSEFNWDRDKNSSGEGLILLKNGHILISKEKKPFMLIEFSIKPNKAVGYDKKYSIEHAGNFPNYSKNIFYPVKKWELEKNYVKKIKDVSGINIDIKGNLYLLSDASNLIALVGNKIASNSKTLVIEKVFNLPIDIKKAEGMIIDELNRPIITTDSKSTKGFNFFVLSPLN